MGLREVSIFGGKMAKAKEIIMYKTKKKVLNSEVFISFGIVKEGLISSILKDIFTFGIMLFSFWVNAQFINSKMVSCILLFCFLVAMWDKSKDTKTETFEEFIEEARKLVEQ